jgi:hypothetical protein
VKLPELIHDPISLMDALELVPSSQPSSNAQYWLLQVPRTAQYCLLFVDLQLAKMAAPTLPDEGN